MQKGQTMFTGIVQGIAKIIKIENHDAYKTFHVELPVSLSHEIKIGASIANDGCCLTVTSVNKNTVTFDVVSETLFITTLKHKKVGNFINIERSLMFGSEIGGHLMSGHIFCEGKIVEIYHKDQSCDLTIEAPQKAMPYIFHKGFIGIDGASLTVGKIEKNQFQLHLIPETLNLTTLKWKEIGDHVNIELDSQTQAIVDTVERYLSAKSELNEN